MIKANLYRPNGLYAIIAVVTLGYFAFIAWVWQLPRGVDTPDDSLGWIAMAAIVTLGLVLTRYAWIWLQNRLTTMIDLAFFLIVIGIGVFTALAFGGWWTAKALNEATAMQRRFNLVPVAAIAICILFWDFTWHWFKIQKTNVEGGTIAVVKRNGVFHRFELPGQIWFVGRAEQLGPSIQTKKQSWAFTTDILRVGDLAYKYSLRVNYRFTPLNMPQPTDNKLQLLTPYNREFRALLISAVQAALQEANREFKPQEGVSMRAARAHFDWFNALLLVIPDTSTCQMMILDAEKRMRDSLKIQGIKLDGSPAIIVERFHIPRDLKSMLTTGGVQQLLRSHAVILTSADLSQVFNWVEKALPLNISAAPTLRSATVRSQPRPTPAPEPRPRPRPGQGPELRPASSSGPLPSRSGQIYTLTTSDLNILRMLTDVAVSSEASSAQSRQSRTEGPIQYTLSPQDLIILRYFPD